MGRYGSPVRGHIVQTDISGSGRGTLVVIPEQVSAGACGSPVPFEQLETCGGKPLLEKVKGSCKSEQEASEGK